MQFALCLLVVLDLAVTAGLLAYTFTQSDLLYQAFFYELAVGTILLNVLTVLILFLTAAIDSENLLIMRMLKDQKLRFGHLKRLVSKTGRMTTWLRQVLQSGPVVNGDSILAAPLQSSLLTHPSGSMMQVVVDNRYGVRCGIAAPRVCSLQLQLQ